VRIDSQKLLNDLQDGDQAPVGFGQPITALDGDVSDGCPDVQSWGELIESAKTSNGWERVLKVRLSPNRAVNEWLQVVSADNSFSKSSEA
jgi:hypothetical protein